MATLTTNIENDPTNRDCKLANGKTRIDVYANGSCLRNPGPGGWGLVAFLKDDIRPHLKRPSAPPKSAPLVALPRPLYRPPTPFPRTHPHEETDAKRHPPEIVEYREQALPRCTQTPPRVARECGNDQRISYIRHLRNVAS
jgi:hypothetical protein